MLTPLNSLLSRWQEWWWLALIAFLLGAIPSWYPIIKEWRTPRFRFQAITGFTGRGAFTQFTKWEDGWHVNPIDLAMTLRVANNDSRPRGISGYELEVRSSGNWVRLDRVELVPPAVLEFRASATDSPSCIDFRENSLHARMRSQAIDPGQSIEGWAFFTSVRKPAYLTSLDRVRLTIFDTLGNKTRMEGPLPDKSNANTSLGTSQLVVLPRSWVPPWRGGTTPPPKPAE